MAHGTRCDKGVSMATMSFNYDSFKAKGITKQMIESTVPLLGMEIERSTQEEFTVDITPNRPDMLDFIGFSRALLLFNKKRKPAKEEYVIKTRPSAEVTVSNTTEQQRPYIGAFIARKVSLDQKRLRYLMDSSEKLCETLGRKRKRIAIGIHNLDAVVLPLTYEAVSDATFVPLNETKAARFSEILKKHQKGIEYANTIATTNQRTVFPCLKDKLGPIAMIPIINSERTKVSTSTKNLLVDITGTSVHALNQMARILACSFIDAGAEVYPCKIIYTKSNQQITPDLKSTRVGIDLIKVSKTIGVEIKPTRALELLNMLGYYATTANNAVDVWIPPYRTDVINWQDIAEDIAIAYGYNNIIPKGVPSASAGTPSKQSVQLNVISKIMLGLGYFEAMNTYLTNEEIAFERMLKKPDLKSVIKIAYSKTKTYTVLRTSILPQLIDNLAGSAHEKMPQKLFEVGSVFTLQRGNVIDEAHIAFVSEHSKANFTEAKSALESLLTILCIPKWSFQALEDPLYINGRAASLIVNGKKAGEVGEISPEVLSRFKLEEPVCAAELSIPELNSIL